MAEFRRPALAILAGTLSALVALPDCAWAQAPTIEQSGLATTSTITITPGSTQSLLGPMPGAGATMGVQPGRDELLFARPGASGARFPASIAMPGGTYQGPPAARAIAAPQPLPAPTPLFYGRLEIPRGREDEGPPDGVTLDQAVERYVHQNLELRAKFYEIPQARADILTASLRANPILYADAQLVPYGSFSPQRPGGPTQYDMNISHPIDYSHKRRARTALAGHAMRVTEALYQDEVRRGINTLCMAYVDFLAARRTVTYARVSVAGLTEFVRANEALYQRGATPSADVDQARSERAVAAISLLDSEEALRQRKRVLAELLNVPAYQSDALELRGAIDAVEVNLPPEPELLQIALSGRADVVAYRLGVQTAEAGRRLALANRFSDAYLLYQPFTYQNNAPFGKGDVPAWALGITVPLPVYNRNQGNIARAEINVTQSEVQLAMIERRVQTEVLQALSEYRTTRTIVARIRDEILPALRSAIDARDRLFREGEVTVFAYLEQTRKYNETAKAYLDAAVRHRKSMLLLNTALGERIMP
jgi:cobalt-zinc-cadmium efflux system outer membrane protein